MEVRSVEAIVRGWNQAGVRYLIVGGLAVVAHGYVRFTADFDVILDFNRDNLQRAADVLEKSGYLPRIPAQLVDLSEEETRRDWFERRNMLVFSFWTDQHAMTIIDIFIEHPLNFEEMMSRAVASELPSGEKAIYASLQDLLLMKRSAGRPQDLADIAELSLIHQLPS